MTFRDLITAINRPRTKPTKCRTKPEPTKCPGPKRKPKGEYAARQVLSRASPPLRLRARARGE